MASFQYPPSDTAALEQQLGEVQETADQAAQAAAAADDRAANAQAMARRRDETIYTLQEAIDALQDLGANVTDLSDASMADRAALHDAVTALGQRLDQVRLQPGPAGDSAYDLARVAGYGGTMTQWLATLRGADGKDGSKGAAGETGPAGTANLALGLRPIPLVALGASTSVTLPWTRTMPNTTYNVAFAHSAVLDPASVTYSVTAKTTASVTLKVTANGIALVAGTLGALAW